MQWKYNAAISQAARTMSIRYRVAVLPPAPLQIKVVLTPLYCRTAGSPCYTLRIAISPKNYHAKRYVNHSSTRFKQLDLHVFTTAWRPLFITYDLALKVHISTSYQFIVSSGNFLPRHSEIQEISWLVMTI